MPIASRRILTAATLAALVLAAAGCAVPTGPIPDAPLDNIPADLQPNAPVLAVVHATGYQLYTCTADAAGNRTFTFKAPEATFGSAHGWIGKHYAGPTWETADGCKITAKKIKEHPSPSEKSIPWLMLEVQTHEGSGLLTPVATILRINTKGGKAPDPADFKAGDVVRVPYSADYVFYGAAGSMQPPNP